MKWIYGKQEVKTLERGQENCYLMTNGLGGFSSMTMIGSVARNDHALLMGCKTAPNERYNLIHRLKETLSVGVGAEATGYTLSSQEFKDENPEEGYRYLTSFTYEDTPIWRFHVNGIEVIKEIGMPDGLNTIGIQYTIINRGKKQATQSVTPFFQFVPKGQDIKEEQEITYAKGRVAYQETELFLRTNGVKQEIAPIYETYRYAYDICDGRRAFGTAQANHQISITVKPGQSAVLEVIYEMEPSRQTASDIFEKVKESRGQQVKMAGFKSEIAKELSKSAISFISKRESTGGSTILAGFPFFEDWGRDTMLALPGVCLATGQYATAKEILRTFAIHEKDGLMPNLFPEGGMDPLYNTVDAALLFINCVYLYDQAVGDVEFLEEMYPVMKRIIEGYQKGTHFAIHMEADGLISAGEGLAQVTWMDVRVGDILPTPRHGKPVEINAYWYNALRIMEVVGQKLQQKTAVYKEIAERVQSVFPKLFWMEEKKCLKDVLSGTSADEQIRCNQIWAVSMPFTMLNKNMERCIVETVFTTLYTPYGLRTLEEEDPEFHPCYEGEMKERDMAYHQGTVWPFPLGAYYLSYLKVHDYCEEAMNIVREQLEVMESALREGCVGQLPEIYDGGNQSRSKGCFAQAWSVGEILRVYEVLEKKQR